MWRVLAAALLLIVCTGCEAFLSGFARGLNEAERSRRVARSPTPRSSTATQEPENKRPPLSPAHVRVSHEPPTHSAFEPFYRALEDENAFEPLAHELSRTFEWREDLTLGAVECGQANAFYDPRTRSVWLCYELMYSLARELSASQRFEVAYEGTLGFVLAHELGHAFIDVFDLPATGREEDAADQIGTLLLLEANGSSESLISAAAWFGRDRQALTATAFADEHSLGAQRYFNILCWVYGSDPRKHRYLSQHIPASRVSRCPVEFSDMESAWEQLLHPHLAKP